MFVRHGVRKSLLAKMLGELLDTRAMVKASMKGQDHDRALLKLLNARQLALKFLANVTSVPGSRTRGPRHRKRKLIWVVGCC